MFGTLKTEPLDVHFEQMGFETSDVIINISSVVGLLVVVCLLANLIVILTEYGPSDNAFRTYFGQLQTNSVWKIAIIFLDYSFLFLSISCAISLYQKKQGVEINSSSRAISVILIVLMPAIMLKHFANVILGMSERDKRLALVKSEEIPEITEMRRSREMANLGYQMYSYARRIALAVVVTFGRASFLAQLLFIYFSSVIAIAIVSRARPLKYKGDRRMELWNEFLVLVLYCWILTQTEYVEDPKQRIDLSWAIMSVITLSVITNFSYVVISQFQQVYWWVKNGCVTPRVKVFAKQNKLAQAELALTVRSSVISRRSKEGLQSIQEEQSNADFDEDPDALNDTGKKIRPDEDYDSFENGVERVSRKDRITVKTRAKTMPDRLADSYPIQGNHRPDSGISKQTRQGIDALIADIEGALDMSDSDDGSVEGLPEVPKSGSESSTMVGFGLKQQQKQMMQSANSQLVVTTQRSRPMKSNRSSALPKVTSNFTRSSHNLVQMAADIEKKNAEAEEEYELV